MMRKRLSRRMFLAGTGAAITLPYLEAMTPVRTLADTPDEAMRLVFIWVPNGLIRTNITPFAGGAGYTPPSLLQPIADMQDHFMVLSGLSNLPGAGRYTYPDGTESNDGPGDHARDTGTFLTCARLKKTDGSDIENGISVDQVAANHLALVTPEIPSLVLATRSGSYGGDSGYAPIYKSNISWTGTTTPADKETSPRAVFRNLFMGYDPGAAPVDPLIEMSRIAREQSILDSTLGDLASLRLQLGARDNAKLDEYLTGVRQLEVRLDASSGPPGGPICDPGAEPTTEYNFEEHVELMFDVMALAFQCDRTRVVSLLMDKGGTYDFLGIGSNHHQISHLENGNSDVVDIEDINRWQIESFGILLRKLQAHEEGDGSNLLDNTLVMFGGGLDGTGHSSGDPTGDLTPRTSGPVHRHTNLPILLGGHGRGAVTSGRHVVYTDREPIADLYISMLQAAGVPATSFGLEGTGPLHSLT